MYSKNKSLFCVFLFVIIFIFAGVLFAFSISAASENEALDPTASEAPATEEVTAEDSATEEPITEDAVLEQVTEEPTVDTPSAKGEASAEKITADIVDGPLEVRNSAGQLATTDECGWDNEHKVFSIKASGLTFIGKNIGKFPETADCSISCSVPIDSVTFNNVNIVNDSSMGIVNLYSTGDLTINIINRCSVAPSSYGYTGNAAIFASSSSGGTLAINGNSSSYLWVKANYNPALLFSDYFKNKFTGGVSINAESWKAPLETSARELIFDSDGSFRFYTTRAALIYEGIYSIVGTATSFRIEVYKGFIELRGADMGAIYTNNTLTDNILWVASGLPLVGSAYSFVDYDYCIPGVYMKSFGSAYLTDNYSISYIGENPANTIFIGSPNPEPEPEPVPTPGGGSGEAVASETAQTWDTVPSAAIALIVLIAIGSFVVLRSRKSHK